MAVAIRILSDTSDETVENILELQKLIFPVELRLNREEIVENLTDPENFNFFLKEDEKVIGYLFAQPQNAAIKDPKLRQDDPDMKPDSQRYYIDQVVLVPEEREGLLFIQLGLALLRELRKKYGVSKVSSHILAVNGLHKIIGKVFEDYITSRRMIDLPSFGGGPYEYMEVDYAIKN